MDERRDELDDKTLLLIDRAKEGDTKALGNLYELYERRLSGAIRKKLGDKLRGRMETQDLVQSVWKDVLVDLRGFTYRGSDSFFRWLLSCVIRKIQDKGRYFMADKRNIDRETCLPMPGRGIHEEDQPKARDPSPSHAVTNVEELERLMGYLDRVPDAQRQALVLHLKDKKDFEEIATIMNRSPDAVRKLYYRGIKVIGCIMHQEKQSKKHPR